MTVFLRELLSSDAGDAGIEGFGDEDGLRFRMIQEIKKLALNREGIEVDHQSPDFQNGIVADDIRRAVGQKKRHPVSFSLPPAKSGPRRENRPRPAVPDRRIFSPAKIMAVALGK